MQADFPKALAELTRCAKVLAHLQDSGDFDALSTEEARAAAQLVELIAEMNENLDESDLKALWTQAQATMTPHGVWSAAWIPEVGQLVRVTHGSLVDDEAHPIAKGAECVIVELREVLGFCAATVQFGPDGPTSETVFGLDLELQS